MNTGSAEKNVTAYLCTCSRRLGNQNYTHSKRVHRLVDKKHSTHMKEYSRERQLKMEMEN